MHMLSILGYVFAGLFLLSVATVGIALFLAVKYDDSEDAMLDRKRQTWHRK